MYSCLKKVFKFLLTSAISFLFISGLIFIVNTKLNFFDIVNSATLKNVSSALPQQIENYRDSDSAVLLISNTLFETEFNSITPLNKDKLQILLEKVLVQKPNTIVLDLDISPDYNFDKSKSFNSELFDYLEEISDEVNIVLPFTFIATTQENIQTKQQWIERMCKSNIHFAFPLLESEIGTVLQYRTFKNHVSVIANNSVNIQNDEMSICSQFSSQKNIKKLEEKSIDIFKKSPQIPINYSNVNTSSIILDSFNTINEYNLKDKVVFIGGSYGFTDKYITPYGEKNGVEILNAIFYSLNHNIDSNNVTVATIIDILIGISFGFIVSILVRQRIRIETNNQKLINNTSLIVVLIVFMFLSFILSTTVFHKFYIWINPFPIVLGMFIDLLIGMDSKKFKETVTTSWLSLLFRYGVCLIGIYSYFSGV